MEPILSLADTHDLMQSPGLTGDEGDYRLLAVDLATADGFDTELLPAIAAWLSAQPVPVIGINAGAIRHNSTRDILTRAVDLLDDANEDYHPAADAIHRNPMASAVLVQVLRTIDGLPIHLALGVESLAYATLQGGEEFYRWLAGRTRHPEAPHPTAPSPVKLARDGAQLGITLDSPANRNALSVAMRDALTEAFKLVAADPSVTNVQVRANGPCFSAGGDLTEFGTANDLTMAHRIRTLRMPARYLAEHAERYTFHLHGACIGAGIELPAFAGRLLAAKDTFFRLPEVAMGLIPGAGGCVSISRRIGRHRTALMAITGETIQVDQALAWGLVDAIED